MKVRQTIMTLFWAGSLTAQSNGIVINGKWADQISVSDVNGRPFENKYADVNGTPYFNTAYKFSVIKLTQGRTFANIKTRIDLAAQETFFIASNDVEAYMEAGAVKEITYTDTTAAGVFFYKFQTGFPSVDQQTKNNFYQVLSEGRCNFVRSIVKKIVERKNELSGEIAKDFETTENYYVFIKNEMKRLKRDKDFVLAALSDKQERVNQFILSEKINFKNTESLKKLFDFYNSL